jgi:chromosome partitioning protein
LLSAEAQYFALQGVEQALEVIELARETLNPGLEWLGVVLNIADMRTKHSREAFASLREHFGDKLLDTTIRSSIAYAESSERAVSILDYRPDLGTDYLDVADELLKRLGMSEPRKALRKLRG